MKIDTQKWRDNISRHPDEVEKEYDTISHHYDDELTAKGYLAPHHAGELIKAHIPDPHCAILDAGCGTGLFGQEAKKLGFDNITGIDISSECLGKAKQKQAYIKTAKHNLLEPFPFEAASFDCVTCIGVFSRFDTSQIKQIVTEFARVLKTGGFAIFSHRDNLIDDALKQALKEIDSLELEELTEPLTYFAEDEHYKDVAIRFFVLKKS